MDTFELTLAVSFLLYAATDVFIAFEVFRSLRRIRAGQITLLIVFCAVSGFIWSIAVSALWAAVVTAAVLFVLSFFPPLLRVLFEVRRKKRTYNASEKAYIAWLTFLSFPAALYLLYVAYDLAREHFK